MHSLDASSCQCANCPGRDCSCGCQGAVPHPQAGSAGCACLETCGCGCDAAESGCHCAASTLAA